MIGLFYSSHFCSVSESGCCWKSCLINEEAGITHLSVWLFWGADNNTFSAVSLSLTLAHNRSRNVQVFGLKTSWHRLRSWKWKSWYLNLNVQKKKKNPQYRNNKIDWSKISSLSFPCYALSSITNTSSATAAPHSGDCQCCMPFLFHLLTVSLVATPRDLNLDCVMSRVRTCLFPSTALDNFVFPKYIYIHHLYHSMHGWPTKLYWQGYIASCWLDTLPTAPEGFGCFDLDKEGKKISSLKKFPPTTRPKPKSAQVFSRLGPSVVDQICNISAVTQATNQPSCFNETPGRMLSSCITWLLLQTWQMCRLRNKKRVRATRSWLFICLSENAAL